MNNKPQPQPQLTPIQVRITPEDLLVCDCGSEFFVQCFKVARTANPDIGAPPLLHPLAGYMCANCGEVVEAKTKTKKEVSNGV